MCTYGTLVPVPVYKPYRDFFVFSLLPGASPLCKERFSAAAGVVIRALHVRVHRALPPRFSQLGHFEAFSTCHTRRGGVRSTHFPVVRKEFDSAI